MSTKVSGKSQRIAPPNRALVGMVLWPRITKKMDAFAGFALALTALAVVVRRRPKVNGGRLPRVLAEHDTNNEETRWLRFKRIIYMDHNGVVREWEKVERRRQSNYICDGVLIFARIVGGKRDGQIPFVKQYRPCIDAHTIELPAGLVDANETCEQAAVRELYEETGLVDATVTHVSPLLFLDPGVSNCSAKFVSVIVDGTLEENQHPKQQLDAGEFCEVIYLQNPTRDTFDQLSASGLAIQPDVYYTCLFTNKFD